MGAKYSTGCGNDLPIFLRDHYFRICGPISSYSGIGHLRLAAHLVAQLKNLPRSCWKTPPFTSSILEKLMALHLALNASSSLLERSSARSTTTTETLTHSSHGNSSTAAAPMAASSSTLQQSQCSKTSQS